MFKKIFKSAEYLFVILSLILYTGGIIDIIAIDGYSEGDGGYSHLVSANDKLFVIKQLMFYFTYIVSFFLLTKTAKKSTKISAILAQNIYIYLLVGLTILSTAWSELPNLTMPRSIALLGTTIFGIYLANRYTLREQLVLLKHTFWVIIVMSIAFAIFIPQYGLMGAEVHAGAWRGIYTHKNEFSRIIALGGIIFLMQPSQNRLKLKIRSIGQFKQYVRSERFKQFALSKIRRNSFLQSLFIVIGLSLSILLILLSRSSGGLVTLIIITIAFAIFKISQLPASQRFLAILGVVVLCAILAVVLIPNPESIFVSLGKSSDLSGRSDIWQILLDLLSSCPLLGFGYGSFWEKYGSVVALAAAWEIPNAHNGFLDLTLSVGYVGLGLFIFSYLSIFTKCLARFRDRKSNENIYPLIVLIYIVISNISESGLFSYNYIYWLLYVMVGYSTQIAGDRKPNVDKPASRSKTKLGVPTVQ